jgi:hypothetical protein
MPTANTNRQKHGSNSHQRFECSVVNGAASNIQSRGVSFIVELTDLKGTVYSVSIVGSVYAQPLFRHKVYYSLAGTKSLRVDPNVVTSALTLKTALLGVERVLTLNSHSFH